MEKVIEIKVLGSGCAKCKMLTENVKKAVEELKLNAEVIKITDMNEIMKFDVMMTPALVINEKVVSSGKLLKPAQIVELLKSNGE